MMQAKGQSAIEFLTTYSFTFLIIALMLFLLLLFSSLPRATLPLSCTFYSGFNCIDNSFFNLGFGSQFVVVATSMEPGVINISNFSVSTNIALSSNGYCTPSVLTAGQTVYCVANFSIPITLGNLYTVSFHITSNYCGSGTGSIDNATCKSSIPANFLFAGQAKTQGTFYTPLDLPPIQNIFCVGSTASPTHTYYSTLGGVASSNTANWISGNNYPISLTNAGCSIYRNYIYCVGSSTNPQTQTYYAPLSYTGIGNWIATNSYPIKFNSAGCSSYQGKIYCVGSNSGNDNQVYYAPISSFGIGVWTSTNSYPLASNSVACSIYNNFMYCLGSAIGGENQAYYAPLNGNGIGNWISTTNYPIQFGGAGCSALNGYIYCVGSKYTTGTQAYYAPISSQGIGVWKGTTSYPVDLSNAGCTISNGNIYCGGSSTAPSTQVYYAPISSQGIGTWKAGSTFPIALQSAYCVSPGSGGGLYSGGGSN